MDLDELYDNELLYYKNNGKMNVSPCKMLTLLLLDNKDDFFPRDANIWHFYQDYGEDIKKPARKLEKDFNLDPFKDDKEFLERYSEAVEVLFSGVTEMRLIVGKDVYKYFYGEIIEDNKKFVKKKVG